MQLITRFELASRSETELHDLLREAFNVLAQSDPQTFQRRNALAAIETLQGELASRALSL